MPQTATNVGLHEFVAEQVLLGLGRPGLHAVDLGTGPGAMAARLHVLGYQVLGVDRRDAGFEAGVPHLTTDLNEQNFAVQIGIGQFDLVTAIEVIEHVENPIGFLRNVGRLLSPGGIAVLTTPNVDSLPARVKFLLSGKIRTMDERGDPTHISPIFFDLFRRHFLPQAGMVLRRHLLFPPKGYQLTRRPLALLFRIASLAFPGDCLLGDNHVLVLEARK